MILPCSTSCSRHKPTLEEIRTDVLTGVGGLCYNLNVATFYLLQALGYTASLASATCTSSVISPGNHIIVYITDLVTPGDKYLVEVAVGFPTFRAVSLDFEEESPVFVDSFIEYKYVKHNGQILRMHRKGCPVRARGCRDPPINFYLGEWRRFYMAEVKSTTDVTYFDKYFEGVWTQPDLSPFHTSIRVVGFPNKKAVMVVNQKMMIEDDKGNND